MNEKEAPPVPVKEPRAKTDASLSIANTQVPDNCAAAVEINQLHLEIVAASRATLEKAIRICELLTLTKSSLPHGRWLPWLATNVSLTERTARDYMRFYREQDRLKSATVADLTEAYALLSERAPEVDTQQLETVERRIERQLPELLRIQAALQAIRDQRLYRQTHSMFENYCRQRWSLGPELIEVVSTFLVQS